MKKIILVLVVAVLLGGLGELISPTMGIAEFRGELVDVKLDADGGIFILYLLNQKPIKVFDDGITIKYGYLGTTGRPIATIKKRGFRDTYLEVTIVFKDRDHYLEYFKDIKITKQKDDIGSCFIATAAYGTPLHEDLDVLRDFRDNVLKKNWLGQKFVDWYYANGPAMAEWVSKTELRKAAVRDLLIKPAVFVLKNKD